MHICMYWAMALSQVNSLQKSHNNEMLHNRIRKLRLKDNITITLAALCWTSVDVAHHMKIALSNAGIRKERIPSICLSFMFLATGWDLLLISSISDLVSRHPIPEIRYLVCVAYI